MDAIVAVVLCNCAIAIVVLAITLWTIRFRRRIVALSECFERWADECDLRSIETPTSIAASQSQIHYLRQIYRQQLLTLDRLRALGLFSGIVRSVLVKRRR